MALQPTKTLLTTACFVGASTALLPRVTGYGTDLFQIVALGAWMLVARATSGEYADRHHPAMWFVALCLNLLLFLVPTTGIWLVARRRWPERCSLAIVGFGLFYIASLFWLFPATDGP
jgi:hypothetical protein